MKRLPSVLCCLLLSLSVGGSVCAQTRTDRDEQMINASLRFIKEKATLNRKEYQKFAKIYSEYNESLAALNRELKPENPEYIKRWNTINNDYNGKLAKELADSTRHKIGMAQWELSQKIFERFSHQNRQEMDAQTQMWMRSAQMNHPFMMMQPQVMDARRRQMESMEQLSEQQRQWRENFRRNWHLPDSIVSDSIRSMIHNGFRGPIPGHNVPVPPMIPFNGGVPAFPQSSFPQSPSPQPSSPQSPSPQPSSPWAPFQNGSFNGPFNPMFHRIPR